MVFYDEMYGLDDSIDGSSKQPLQHYQAYQ